MITAGFLGIFTMAGLYVLFQSWREWARKIAAASAKGRHWTSMQS